MDSSFHPRHQPSLDEKYTVGRFNGSVAVVTGGASGIGFATAYRFCNDGAFVAILDCNKEAGKAAAANLKSEGLTGNVKFYYVDVAQKHSCEEATKEVAADHHGKIDHLVNAAAYFGSKGINAATCDWMRSFEVNVVGYSNMVQACLPYFTKGSTVVNLTSISAKRAQPDRWTYASTKGAIDSMTRCMALDLSKKGIRVNSASPSWIWSPEQRKASVDGSRQAMAPIVAPFHMLSREGETSEVAAVVTFLSSRDASFVTGADFAVDGGYTAMGPEQHGMTSSFGGTSENTK